MPVRLIDPAQSRQRAASGTSYRSSTRGGDRRRAFGPYAPRLSAWPLRIWLRRFAKGAAWRNPARRASSELSLSGDRSDVGVARSLASVGRAHVATRDARV